MKFPCSYHQERLWFIDNFENGTLYPHSPVYHNLPLILEIEGELDTAVLQACITTIISEYSILGTSIITENGVPLQVIDTERKIFINYLATETPLTYDERLAYYAGIIKLPFRLNEQLFRVHLLQCGAGRQTIIFTAHHIIADRVTMKMIARRCSELYNNALPGNNNNVTTAHNIPFTAFAKWQKSFPEETIEALLLGWRAGIKNIQPLELHADRKRALVHIYNDGLVIKQIPSSVQLLLSRFSEMHGFDEVVLFMAAFKVLLHKYTAQENITIGTVSDIRDANDLQHTLGPLANLLPIHTRINGDTTFLQLLQLVQGNYGRALKYKDLPFDKLVSELKLTNDMARTALFDVLFHYEKSGELKLFDNNFTEIETNAGLGKYDLNLLVKEQAGNFHLYCTYNKEYYDAVTVQNMMQHYIVLFENLLQQPGVPIDQLHFLSVEDQSRWALALDHTQAAHKGGKTIVDLFEEQVRQYPGQIAVSCNERQWPYYALNETVNQFAHFLTDRYNIKSEDLVAIQLERSEWQIISMLAVLKAGAAYLPVDPSYPEERIQFLLEDSASVICIDQEIIDAFVSGKENYSAANRNVFINANQLAYVIYTSGSTGKPKGVLIEHHNVVRLLKPERSQFNFSCDDVWTLFHSFSFDFSVWEIFGALLYGGRLVIVPRDTATDTYLFRTLLQKEQVTVLNQTPAAFYKLQELVTEEDQFAIRYVIFGGEKLLPSKLRKWKSLYPRIHLINMYGITETTVHTTYKEIKEADIEAGFSNIGKPLHTVSCYVLDAAMRPLPAGVAGELYVGGEGVARGYYNRTELTAEKFLPNPFGAGRLYKSGDKAIILSAGEIEYLGRLDDQVKIRGYRIEPAEIERVLQGHKLINNAVVLIQKDQQADEHKLVAYITAKGKIQLSDIRNFLKKELPDYMVPADFVQVDIIPMTVHGKVDKQLLSREMNNPLLSDITFKAPSNETETTLVAIWEQVLGRTGIGVQDDFFALGGHSIKAMEVLTKIQEAFQVQISVKSLFLDPTIEHLSKEIQQRVLQVECPDGKIKDPLPHSILPVAPQKDYVLSFAQKRLWIISQLPDASIAYNLMHAIELNGYNIDCFSKAVEFVVDRHEVLRTVFRENSRGEIRQCILTRAQLNFRLQYIDLRKEEDQEAAITSFLQQEMNVPFDLYHGPLIQAGFLQTGEQQHHFYCIMHHIISDGWSTGILLQELMHCYQSFTRNERPELSELTIQYKDYAAWQQQSVERGLLKNHQSYWVNRFAGEIPVLNLPADHARPAVQTYKGGALGAMVNAETVAQLKQLSQEMGGTLYMTLLSALYALFYRYTGQEDIVIGSPIAGRELASLSNQIGCYVNNLALRTSFSGNEDFRSLFARVRETTMNAYEHQSYPVDRLIEELQLKRDLSHSPLFDVVLAFQNQAALQADSIQLSSETGIDDLGPVNIKLDIHINVVEVGDALYLRVEYNSNIYSKDTISRLIQHYKNLLSVVSANPQTPLRNIVYLSQQEQHQLLYSFNNTASDYPADKTIVSWLQERVKQIPDQPAIVYEQRQLTYRELDEKSNRLAHYLRKKGITTEMPVPVLMDRSEELIISILGILKAGGAYVPIDAEYPQERITHMISDTAATIVISHSYYRDIFTGYGNLVKIYIDLDWFAIENEPADALEMILQPVSLAYIVYTSGSTGKPKGVMISHTSVVNLIHWHIQEYKVHIGSRSTVMAGIGFDAFALEIWSALLSGSCMYIVRDEMRLQRDQLMAFLHLNHITHSFIPPALIPGIVNGNQPEELALKYILIGGDRLAAADVSCLTYTLVNQYGPAESTVMVTSYPLGIHSNEQPPPIGKPLSNTQVYILDQAVQLVPLGVTGEIYIGGVQLARGYWNRPELTAERFINNPFATYGSRLYRTGDLGRWLPDGNIEYVGRIDDQVKIRGYRIELAEVEHALLQLNGIDAALVTLYEEEAGHKNLAAYIVSGQQQQIQHLRRNLEQLLPSYMVPAYFVQVNEFPLTANGKIDKTLLPDPVELGLSSETTYTAARNETEEAIIVAARHVLNRDRIGIKDNFFDLGGDSIKAILLVSQLKERGYMVKVGDVLKFPVFEELGLQTAPYTQTVSQLLIEGDAILTPVQRWFLESAYKKKHHYNQSVLLKSRLRLEQAQLQQCLHELVLHHDALRLQYHQHDGLWKQSHSNTATSYFSIEEHDLRHLADEQDALTHLCQQLQERIDLEQGPLVRTGIFRLRDGDRLLLVIHHLVVDGVSWRILLEDLFTLYQQKKNGEPLRLPAKTDAFQVWARQLEAYARTQKLQEELSYWLKIINAPTDKLPTDFNEPEHNVKDSGRLGFVLNKEQTNHLLTRVNQVYHTTTSDVLLAALGIALKEVFDVSTILVALEGHGREDLFDIDITRTVGWFTTAYPALLQIDDSAGLQNSLVSVKEQLRQIPAKGIGYGLLRYLHEEGGKKLPQTLITDITFNYLGDFGAGVSTIEAREALFDYSGEDRGQEIHDEYVHDSKLLVSGAIVSGCLHMNITYSNRQFARDTINKLALAFEHAIKKLIFYLIEEKHSRLTPSDCTYKKLSVQDLQELQQHGEVEDVYELSPLQEGIYYHWLAEPGTTAYFQQVSYRLQGSLNISMLQNSYSYLVRRHPILRTRFSHEYGTGCLQIVCREVPDNFSYHDLQLVPDKQSYVKDYKEKDRKTGFDLAKGSQMRLSVLGLGNDEYEFIWSHHHILMDGWCGGLLIKEFYTIYRSLLNNRTPELPAIPPYVNYINWLAELNNDVSIAYWKKYLEDYGALSEVPFKERKQTDAEYAIAEEILSLDNDQSQLVRQVCRRLEITANTFLQTAWGYLLSRYNNTQDVVFGTVVSGRPAELPGVDTIVGLFINSIPVRIQYGSSVTGKELLVKVQQQAIECLPHHYLQLSAIQNNSPLGNALFDHLVVYENFPVQSLVPAEMNDHGLEQLKLLSNQVTERTNYDFTVVMAPGANNTIQIAFRYNGNRFTQQSVHRIKDHFKNVIQYLSIHVDEPLSALSFITANEQLLLIEKFNNVTASFPKQLTIADLIYEQAARTPGNIAVTYEQQQITYHELDTRSNQVAHRLRKLGVKEDTLVPVCMDRSIDMITGILGIVKAGGAYVPIDPDYPGERIEYILSDINANIVVTQSEYSRLFDNRLSLVYVNDPAIALEPVEQVQTGLQSSHLAYVIYTSGSTGTPKGVLIEHKSVVRLFKTDQPLFNFSASDVWTLFHSFCFDFSVWEMYGALFYGGRLVIVPKHISRDTAAFAELLWQQKVTVLNQTPNAFYVLSEEVMQAGKELPVRYVIFGGEALNPARLKSWKERFPGCRLINMYGITETTVHVTYREIGIKEITEGISNIGKAIPTLQCYVLNNNLQLQAVGTAGELYVAGDGLARGYLNRPELTAARFITIQLSGKPVRLYKTGDLVRWLTDGNMEYLGRIDEQVKVRGYRIEPAEIETVLQQHPQVSKSVVIAIKDTAAQTSLAAYIVAAGSFNKAALISWLANRLPEYMVPAHFIEIAAIPLTANGKINRKALPALEETHNRTCSPPRNETEQLLHQIWKEVLAREEISIDDNFFYIGGDSIKAITIVSRLKKTFNKSFGINDLYQYNSIESMSRFILHDTLVQQQQQQSSDALNNILNKLQQEALKVYPEAETAYPMSDIQKGMVFASLVDPAVYNDQLVYQLSWPNFDIDLFTKALSLLTAKHEVLRSFFDLTSCSKELQVVLRAVTPVVIYKDIQDAGTLQEDIIRDFLEENRQLPFDYSKAPMWRVTIFRCSEQSIIMILQAPHAVIDGWSVASLNTELHNVYKALQHDAQYIPAPLQCSYREAALFALQEKEKEENILFWKNELADYKRLDIFTERAGNEKYTHVLGNDRVNVIYEQVKADQVTMQALFLGIYLYALHMLSYDNDITIGLVTNTRPAEEDGDKLLGCFLNTIPVRFSMPRQGQVTWRQYIQSIDKKLRAVKQYDATTLFDISRAMNHTASGENPFFDVLFNYVNFHVYEELNGGSLAKPELENGLQSHIQTNTYLGIDIDQTDVELRMCWSLTRSLRSGIPVQELQNWCNHILDNYCNRPDENISAQHVLPESRLQQVLVEFNKTEKNFGEYGTIVDRFEKQAVITPDNTAVICEEATITYAELNEKANALAVKLNSRQVGPGHFVPLLMPAGIDYVVAFLAVLKTGAVCVPLSVQWPEERLQVLLRETAAAVVLVNAESLHITGNDIKGDVICVAHKELSAGTEFASRTHREAPVYMIYTSGSTGTPKGVIVPHKGIMNRFLWMDEYFGKEAAKAVLQTTSIEFDSSVWQLFWPLTNGGLTIIPQRNRSLDFDSFASLIQKHKVSMTDFVPALFNEMVQEMMNNARSYDLSCLKEIVIGGEAIHVPSVNQFREKYPAIRLTNLYGPTEASIGCVYYEVLGYNYDKIPVGKPISNVKIYIVNKGGEPVPIGVPGEICISGICLAQGYFRDKVRTADKFIENPFVTLGLDYETMYKTGDIGRWLPDGTIEYIGRVDDQVKIRGYRIEPGEIEETLLRYKGISAAAVMVQQGANGEKELAGYYVSDEAIGSNDVRSYLRTVLPVYMVPAWLMRLDALPLTANGKINRQALPAVSVAAGDRAIGYTEPRTALEAQLAGIWQQLFGGIEIGVEDDFFAIGGHSIKLMQLLNHYQRELDVKLTMQELFRHSTIASHALLIEKGRPGQYTDIKQVAPSADYSVSDGQRRLWVLSQIEDSARAYHLPGELHLHGEYSRAYFEQAIQAVISRHEILRTVFRENEQGELRQVVLPVEAAKFQLSYQDLEGAAEKEVRAYLWQEFSKGFELGNGPLLRAGLVRLSKEEYIFHYTVHHIISDGWSMELLRREVMGYYEQYAAGTTPSAEPLRIQYKDYAAWQQAYVASHAASVHRSYWLQQLSGELPVLELGSKVRPAVQTHNGHVLGAVMDKELATKLEQLCREQNSTLFMGLLTVLKALLYRYTGQEDIIIGSPVAGRTHSELEDQIGFYINVLALRTRFSGTDSVKSLLKNIRQVSLLAYEHQGYPVDRLIEELELKRDRSRSPLFDVFVNLENIGKEELASGSELGQSEEIQDLGRSACKYDLIWNFQPTQDGLDVRVEYNSDIFEQTWVKRLINHYKSMLAVLLQTPDAAIKEVEYINEQEKHQLLTEFNDTAVAYEGGSTVLDLLRAMAEQKAASTALRMGAEAISYGQLDKLSDKVAAYLQQQYAVKAGDMIGVQLNRSPWTVVLLIGILKSGAAYMPIDTSYPAGRIAYMLDNSGCSICINETLLNEIRKGIENTTEKTLAPIHLGQLAYVMYTSGSTGRPKGVQVTHGNLYNYINYALKEYFSRKDKLYRMPLFTSLSFDLTVTSLFGTLCAGGELVIYDQTQELADVLEDIFYGEKGINIVKCTPAHIGLLESGVNIAGSVDQVIVGGEELRPWHINTLQGINENIVIYNEYGPTETTVGCMVEKIQGAVTDNNIAIGQPIQNTQIYLLDTARQLVPVGVRGEIYIGGAGVSAGYINNSEQTTERFIANPFGEGTLYKTGDLGRWREDGRLDYLGRTDNQVKVHGYRIELGEIEQVLLQYEGMRQCVVTVKEDEDHNKQLIGYIVTDTPVDTTPITNYLQDRLPAYMVPSRLMRLEWLPLTTNGKIDMMALPGWDGDVRKEKYEAPRTPVEEALVASWAHIFKKERIGIKDNFFELGGDSIKAILMGSQLKQRGYSVRVADILRYPVLEDLAAHVSVITRSADQEVVEGEVVLTPVQQWFLESAHAPLHHFNQSVLLKSTSPLDIAAIKECLQVLLSHHDALRMVYRFENDGWQQYNNGLSDNMFNWQEYDCRGAEAEIAVMENLCNEVQQSIDIAAGPLVNAALFHLSDGDRLLIVIHHLVVDGVSWRILLEDLSVLYKQCQSGEVRRLPLKSDSFKAWAQHQLTYANSRKLEKEWPYWNAVCTTMVDTLPVDMEGSENILKDYSHVNFELDNELTEALQTSINRVFNTDINDILLTALSLSIREVFGLNRVMIGLEGHGREDIGEHINITRTVGWFAILYPVVLETGGAADELMQLVTTKELLRKVPNKGMGYGMLRYLNRQTAFDWKNEAKKEITFNYLGDFGTGITGSSNEDELLFEYADEHRGWEISGEYENDSKLTVTGLITAGQLNIKIAYSQAQYKRDTIQRLSDSYKQQLQKLINSLRTQTDTFLTPADLTWKGLSMAELHKLRKEGPIEDVYELSPLQEGIYYHWLAEPGTTAYVEQVAYTLQGELDMALLKKSYDYLIGRHAILRTSFSHEFGGRCLQIVRKKVPDSFFFEDLAHLPERDKYINDFKNRDRQTGFNLNAGTQMRLAVLYRGEEQYEFIWTHYHILMDGWCAGLLIREFFDIYKSFQWGIEPLLTKVTPFVNYIQWLAEQDQDSSLLHWRQYLRGYDHLSPLPYKQATGPGVAYEGAEAWLEMEGQQVQDINRLCRELGITENTFMQTAWGYLLSRYNNTKDVVFGAVVSGRPAGLSGVEEMIGLFINTLPVRITWQESNTVEELLRTVQQDAISNLPHHFIRLSDVQSTVKLGNNLFDHLFLYENYLVKPGEEGQAEEEQGPAGLNLLSSTVTDQTNYDFNINITLPASNKIRIIAKYNRLSYLAADMQQMLQHLGAVIRHFTYQPQGLLCDVEYLSQAERSRLLNEFNDTKEDFPRGITLLHLFSRQVVERPDEVVLLYKDKKYSYREVEEWSNRLARYMQHKYDINLEDRIAVLLERSEWQIISLLAVLKTGAAYVPIDPSYPRNRIEYLLTDSACAAFIDDKELEMFFAVSDQYAADALPVAISENNLAYIIYTSGSTGNPKGCMLEHKGIINMMEWMWRKCKFDQSDIILQKTTFTFDVSVWEIFLPLCWGCKMVLCEKEDTYSPQRIAGLIARHQVTCVHFVPGLLTAFINAWLVSDENIQALSALKRVVASGEALPVATVKAWYNKMQVPLIDLYGPTEASIDVTCFEATPETELVPIGKPLANTYIYILDAQQQLVPVGIPGEIYCGGIHLARGYWNREELTQEKFIPDPFRPGDRIYRTGDIGRWLPDGNIEYLGRTDDQVKIRGYRIELGEIETLLREFNQVQDAAVVTIDTKSGDKELAAYIIYNGTLPVNDVKRYLEERLPEYMVPKRYIQLDSFPLNSNEKVDRKKLAEPSADGFTSTDIEFVLPGNEIERKLAVIWKEVLAVDREISIKDNFFELGGHSIKAITLLSAIYKELGIMLSMQDLFANPTIKQVGDVIINALWFTGQTQANGNGQQHERIKI